MTTLDRVNKITGATRKPEMHELKVFIRRAEVRAQFRAHLRAAARVPGAAGADVLEQVRST